MWYAQVGEDKFLHELLGPKNQGFFIDIGTCEPVHDSVTMHFYERGWSGINVEPVPLFVEQLRRERPRDTTVACAISDEPGVKEFHFIVGTQLSTFDEDNLRIMSRGREVVNFPVQCLTLSQLCQMHVLPDHPIDFMKIDVEGWEAQVIKGGDWKTYRPRVVLVEATRPASDVPAWDTWDHLLCDEDYNFIKFDGLNRWYIDKHTQTWWTPRLYQV